MDVWDWAREDSLRLLAEGNVELPRVLATFQREFAMVPDAAIERTLAHGMTAAQRTGERYWHAMFLHLSVMYHGIGDGDLARVRDLSLDLLLETETPGFDFPAMRAQAFLNLASAYLGIDPLGYETEIRGVIDALVPEALIAAPESRDDATVMGHAAVLMHMESLLGNTDAALDAWHGLLATGVKPYVGVRCLYGRLLQYQDKVDEARRVFAGCAAEFEEGDTNPMALTCHAWLAELEIGVGNTDEARRHAAKVQALNRRYANPVRTAERHWVHGLIARREERTRDALLGFGTASRLLTSRSHLRQAARAAAEAASVAVIVAEQGDPEPWTTARVTAEGANRRLKKRDFASALAGTDSRARAAGLPA